MKQHARAAVWGLLLMSGLAVAGDGLALPDDAQLWPRWQARLSLTLERPADGVGWNASHGLRQASLLGDYYPSLSWLPTSPSWRGGLRATGGLILGRPGLAVPSALGPSSPWHASLDESRGLSDPAAVDASVWPYIGVGYTGLSRRSGWGFTADLGMVVRQASPTTSPLGLDETLREIRLSPMLQFGVRYAF